MKPQICGFIYLQNWNIKMTKRLIVDTANVLFRVASAHGKYNSGGSAEDLAGLALHTALNTLKSHYNRIRPDQVALTFEGANNWRKAYTKSDECVSKKVYKANRVKDDSMIPFFELIKSFEDLARQHTSLVCLSNPLLEGDDLFAGYVERFTEEGDEVVGLSGDKDFLQLLKYKNFTLINPDKLGDVRGFDKKTGEKIDPIFFTYMKMFRGDSGDNVLPAYPKVRETRIKKAFTDPYEETNIMNETWKFNEPSTGEERVFRVGDLYNENKILMDLSCQPADIKEEIRKTIEHGVQNHGNFSLFHFLKFCGKHKLKKIADDSTTFVNMFATTGKHELAKAEEEEKKPQLILKKKDPKSLVF